MYHLHIYLHRKLPFINMTMFEDGEAEKYLEYKVSYKGAEMHEFPDCKVCRDQVKGKFCWLKYPRDHSPALALDPALTPSP